MHDATVIAPVAPERVQKLALMLEKFAKIRDGVADGTYKSVSEACREVGFDRVTYWRWCRQTEDAA